MPCTDEFLIFVPDSRFRSFVTSRPERVTELLILLGSRARVRRITEGELNRDVTDSFREAEAPDFPAHDRECSRADRLHQEICEGASL